MAKASTKKPGRWKRRLLIAGAATLALGAGFWIAIHEIPGFGPAVAEGTRRVVGPGPVAWAEDTVYGVADWINVRTRDDEAPKTFWQPAEDARKPIVFVDAQGKTVVIDPMEGAPATFDAPFEKVAATGDGSWQPLRSPSDKNAVTMWKSLVHPDPKRPFAAVAVVAMDLQRLDLHLEAGTEEPKSFHVPRAERPGLIAEDDRKELVAGFNGGFRAEHGNYGMRIGKSVFIAPRDVACTVGRAPDGSLTIQTFSSLKDREPSLAWYRQTPPCLAEQGEPNPQLLHEFNRNWGATVGGETIIRRSALGLSKDGRYLFYALGDAVTAQSIGRAMLAVGAHDAAQLDVNFSYPRFFVFEQGEAGPSASQPIIPDIKYSPSEYVGTPSHRDFFYVTRKKSAS